jgi:hypothetical protein
MDSSHWVLIEVAIVVGLAAVLSPESSAAFAAEDWRELNSSAVMLEGGQGSPDAGSPIKSDAPDRPFGSAFFGGDGGPPVFGPLTEAGVGNSAKWPDVSEPGPDMGDFPNSAFTLPRGRSYIEFSPVTLLNADRQAPAAYIAPFLLRYGLSDNVEFRVLGNGLTHVGGSSPSTGFSPLNLDLKVHLWNDRKEWLVPAMSLEVLLLTPWGSSQFTSTWEPSLNLNFDLPIAKKTNLEWTLGYSGVQQAININTKEVFIPRFNFLVPGIHRTFGVNFNQFTAQWALEYEVTDKLEVFAHGFHNGAIHLQIGAGDMVGVGAFYKFSQRLMGFGSINTGLTPNLPSCVGQIGFVLAL